MELYKNEDFKLRENCEPQTYATGIKEVWKGLTNIPSYIFLWPYRLLFESVKKCIASLIGRAQQMDDPFSYVELFLYSNFCTPILLQIYSYKNDSTYEKESFICWSRPIRDELLKLGPPKQKILILCNTFSLIRISYSTPL